MKRTRTARHVLLLSGLAAIAGLAVSSAAAQNAQPETTASPASKAQPVPGAAVNPAAPRTVIVLVESRGKVQVRRPDVGAKSGMGAWEAAKSGVILPEGTQIRVGPDGSAMVQIGSTQRVSLDKFTMMTIQAAANDAGTERTRIDLPMGRLGVDVDSTRVANDVQITTPQTTLAVRGTKFVVEHSSAFGTLAAGAEGNTGSFVVFYNNGAIATVTGTQETSSATPDPAVTREERASIETVDPQIRESDEREVAQRASGTGDALGLQADFSASATELITFKPITTQAPAAISRFLGFDQGTGTVFESDITGGSRRNIVEGVNVFPEAPFSGLSIIEGAGGTRALYLLRSDVDLSGSEAVARNELFAMDLASPQAGFSFQSMPGNNGRTLLQGLGSIGTKLYAHGFDVQGESPSDLVHSIYEVLPTSGDTHIAMELPGMSIGGMGGSNSSGSLFVGGKLGLADGSDQFVFLEVDPRTNYLINAYGGADAELVPTSGTFASAGLDPSSIDNISGLAVVDGILVMAATANVGGRATNVVLQYDPAASNSKTSPRLRRVDAVADASYIGALASERGLMPRASRPLDNPAGVVDLSSINSVFASMAYSQEALEGDVLQRLVANEVLLTARDPSGCAASGALDALPSILRRHVDQTAGVGRSVGEFRLNLPVGHPCGAD